MSEKRFVGLYLHENFCDGYLDRETDEYLEIDELKEIIYRNLNNDEIEEIINRPNDKIDEILNDKKEEKSVMSNFKLVLEGLGLAGYGIFSIIWYLIKIISCIMISGLISIKLGLNSYYWWFSSIIIFSILMKIIFYGNDVSNYEEWVDEYKKKSDNRRIL